MMYVMVAEDNDTLRELMAGALETVGHEVSAVHSGNAAVDLLDQRRPDVIVLDLGLPGVSGLELTRLVRTRWPDAPPRIVGTTGDAHPAAERDFRDAGGDCFLGKPVRLGVLRAAVDGVPAP